MDTQPLLPSEIWERTPPEAQALLLYLATRVATLEATVQELREQLRQDSRTSSRPPSSDPPTRQRERRRRQPSGRRPGGQPGHRGQTRTLVPVEEVDEVIVLKPAFCAHCQQPLDGDDPQPQRHQVFEIPPICPVVTEYQLHRLSCPGCGEATQAAWPAGVPRGIVGPRAQAVGSLCTGAYRLSKRTTQRLLDDLFGLQVSVGTISQLEATTTEAVASPVEEARRFVQKQSSAHLDETGWREGGQRAWLWVAATMWVTVFVVRLSRGGQVARDLFGEALKRQAHQMFHWWHRVRDGTLSRSSFRSYMSPVRREVERLLEAGSTCGVPKTEGMCREILKLRQALWTFVHLAGVEPTNNTAERAIRPGVLWRKGSFGTHSAQGSRFVESMMTVVATLRQQQRNVLEYLTAACEAALRDEPAPSLLPASPVAPSDQVAA